MAIDRTIDFTDSRILGDRYSHHSKAQTSLKDILDKELPAFTIKRDTRERFPWSQYHPDETCRDSLYLDSKDDSGGWKVPFYSYNYKAPSLFKELVITGMSSSTIVKLNQRQKERERKLVNRCNMCGRYITPWTKIEYDVGDDEYRIPLLCPQCSRRDHISRREQRLRETLFYT